MKLVRASVITVLLIIYGFYFGYPSLTRYFDFGVTISRTIEERLAIDTPGEVFSKESYSFLN